MSTNLKLNKSMALKYIHDFMDMKSNESLDFDRKGKWEKLCLMKKIIHRMF